MPGPRIHVPAAFDPWKITALTHDLADHPLLQLDQLIALGQRQQARKLVRTHSGAATAGTSFAEAPRLHPTGRSAEDTLRDLAQANAWMSLLNIQADPIYRAFVDEILDEVRPAVDRVDPGMCYRAGWIFVSSPGAITPFHIDHEHNFILQIRGRKRLYTWPHDDRQVVTDHALELFHDQHSREEVVWRDELRDRAQIFDLTPGQGGYMPSTTGHMVENGPEPSVTISFTYYTDATRANELLYRGNARLRRLGLSPAPVGASAGRDRLKRRLWTTAFAAQARVKRALGRGVRDNGQRYAPA